MNGAAVLDHQAAVAGGGRPGQHPRPRVGGDPGEGPVEGVPGPGAVDRRPPRGHDRKDQRVAGAAVAVGLQDGHVGLVALLAGEGELMGEPARDHPGRGHPGDQDDQPGRDHGQLVAGAGTGSVAAWSASGRGVVAGRDRGARGRAGRRPQSRLRACAACAGRPPGYGDGRRSAEVAGLTGPDS